MCGIAGLVSESRVSQAAVRRLVEPLFHRGPDDDGIWTDPQTGVGLGHRRLAIVDLSPAGHQPMVSADERFVLIFNGEIYNFAEIRTSLEQEGAVPDGGWRGHSDTEVLLQAVATWGLEEALRRSAGMFAFALWDRSERRLSLVRDRFGEKPLYYGWAGRDFVFASELKALCAHPKFDNAINRSAVALFAARTYIPAPHSIYRRVFKLLPGCILHVPLASAREPLEEAPEPGAATGGITARRYWSYRTVVKNGLADPLADEDEALDALETALSRAIGQQSFADVPVGAFLSGGIDSSTIVALYQKHASLPVRTFSIGFHEEAFDEARHARAVAEHLGTVHNEHFVTAHEAQEVIPKLAWMYDEPFADPSQVPTHLVSAFARQQVTVALTGDGGDELFAGYNRHFAAPRLWDMLRTVPKPLRKAGAPLSRIGTRFWSGAASLLPVGGAPHVGAKIQKALAVGAAAESLDDVYRSFLNEWSFGPPPVMGGEGMTEGFDLDLPGAPDAVRMMYCDAVSYLPDDILCKVDRASMAVSLETRVPFLDHRVAELAARIPLGMKVRGGQGKHILRQLLYREVPRELVERPKAGFGIPLGEWVKSPLRDWAEDLLDPARMRAEGFFDVAVIQRRWKDHLDGRRDSSPAIWAILMFQSWLRATRPDQLRGAA